MSHNTLKDYFIPWGNIIWPSDVYYNIYKQNMIHKHLGTCISYWHDKNIYTLNNTKFHMHNIFYSKRGLNYRISKRTTILFVTSYYTVFTMVKIHTPWIHTQIFIDKLLILFVYSNQLFQYDLHLQIYEIIKYQ